MNERFAPMLPQCQKDNVEAQGMSESLGQRSKSILKNSCLGSSKHRLIKVEEIVFHSISQALPFNKDIILT